MVQYAKNSSEFDGYLAQTSEGKLMVVDFTAVWYVCEPAEWTLWWAVVSAPESTECRCEIVFLTPLPSRFVSVNFRFVVRLHSPLAAFVFPFIVPSSPSHCPATRRLGIDWTDRCIIFFSPLQVRTLQNDRAALRRTREKESRCNLYQSRCRWGFRCGGEVQNSRHANIQVLQEWCRDSRDEGRRLKCSDERCYLLEAKCMIRSLPTFNKSRR